MATTEETPPILCAICAMAFSDPRALSCGHSFCLTCLELWSDPMTKQHKLPCPTCAKLSAVPEEGVGGFRQDQNLIASLGREGQTKGRGKFGIEDSEMCPTHQKELDVFCNTCSVAVCSLCLGDDHRRPAHSTQQLVDFLRINSANLGIQRRMLEANKQQVEANLAYIDELFPQLDRDRKAVGDAIAEQATLLAQRVRSDGDALLAELQGKHTEQIGHLQGTRDKWKISLESYNDDLSKSSALMGETRATAFIQRLQQANLKSPQELKAGVVHPYSRNAPPTLEFTASDFIQTLTCNSVGRVRGDVAFVPRFEHRQDFSLGMKTPTCVAFFRDGDIAVCGGRFLNYFSEADQRLRMSSEVKHTSSSVGPLRPSQIYDLAVFSETDVKVLFVVSDFVNNLAYIVDLSGSVKKHFGKNELSAPIGVGVSSTRKVYVANSGSHDITVYKVSGVFMNVSRVTTIGKAGNGRGEFNKPMYLAVNSQDQVIVSDYGNNRIQVLNRDGDFAFEITAAAGGEPLGTPSGVAVDTRDCLYVNNSTGVQLYNSCGTHLTQVVSRESVASMTYGIAVSNSAAGGARLLVTRHGSNDVIMYEEAPSSTSMTGRRSTTLNKSRRPHDKPDPNVSQVCVIL